MTVVIVGGGIVGTAIAARLSSTDRDVVLLERSSIGAETTAASAGIMMEGTVDPTPFDLALRADARSVYRRLFERTDLESTRVGVCYVAETAAFAERLEAAASTLREHGVEASFLEAADLHAHGITAEGHVGALYTPEDALCEPTAVASWFADCARRNGADVRTGATVTDVQTREGAVTGVETEGGRVDATHVIDAAGPWAADLAERVGVSLPLAHTTGPMAVLEAPNPIEAPVTILESKRYVRPAGDGRAWIGEYETGYLEGQRYDPSSLAASDRFLDDARNLDAVVPALEGASVVDDWIGLRTVTPDGRPIVGETDVDGFLVACGMTGQGITLAPAVAEVVAGILSDEIDHERQRRLGLERF